MSKRIVRSGISPVGSSRYRFNRLRFHLLAYAVAKSISESKEQGIYIIRCDDTDISKVNYEYLNTYIKILEDLGVKAEFDPNTGDMHGESLYQSKRGHIYEKYLQFLKDKNLTIKDPKGSILFNTKRFYELYRESMSGYNLIIQDEIKGFCKLDIRQSNRNNKSNQLELKPFPIVRADGSFLFNFASPVDDGLHEVTHIVRNTGKLDLLANQEMVRISLNFPKINYIHTNVLVNSNKKRLISDDVLGEATYQNFLSKGYLPQAIVSYLLAGFSGNSEDYHESADVYAAKLKLNKIRNTNSMFDIAVLDKHQKNALKKVSEKVYLEELVKYLEVKHSNLVYTFEQDLILQSMLEKLRLTYPECIKYIHTFISEDVDDISENSERISNLISLELELLDQINNMYTKSLIIDNSHLICQKLNISFKEYCNSIIYLYTGKCIDLNLKLVLEYLESSEKLIKLNAKSKIPR